MNDAAATDDNKGTEASHAHNGDKMDIELLGLADGTEEDDASFNLEDTTDDVSTDDELFYDDGDAMRS